MCSFWRRKSVEKEETIGRYSLDSACLGEGTFAIVKRARDRATGEEVACKLISKRLSKESDVAREMAMMRKVGVHRHVVSLLDEVELEQSYALFLELVTGGEVFERIIERGAYSEADAAGVVRQVALALEHLHGRGVAHRDLKPENLLLVSDAHCWHTGARPRMTGNGGTRTLSCAATSRRGRAASRRRRAS